LKYLVFLRFLQWNYGDAVFRLLILSFLFLWSKNMALHYAIWPLRCGVLRFDIFSYCIVVTGHFGTYHFGYTLEKALDMIKNHETFQNLYHQNWHTHIIIKERQVRKGYVHSWTITINPSIEGYTVGNLYPFMLGIIVIAHECAYPLRTCRSLNTVKRRKFVPFPTNSLWLWILIHYNIIIL